jgi:phenylacetate-CoA ligase
LLETERMSPVEIEALQLRSLQLLVAHAGAHVPYYRELFKKLGFDARDLRSRADLAALPLLTRETIRERYDDLVDPAFRGRNIKKGTSGSTAAPLLFEYSPSSEYWRRAVRLRGYGWAGYRTGQPALFYWAMPHGKGSWKARLDQAARQEVFIDSMKQDPDSLRAACQIISKLRPHVIVCFTQAGAQLARFAVESGLRDWPDIPVLCGAEAVLPADRAALEAGLGPVFETYGSRETMLMAAECEAHDGMHLAEEHLLVELVKNGRPAETAAPGESGEVVVTDLHDFGMPFIRYQNGDLAQLSEHRSCPCGRGLRKLARVDGRRTDVLYASDGTPIPGLIFHALMADPLQIVTQFQAVQQLHKPGRPVVLRVVHGRDYTEARLQDIVDRLTPYLRGLPLSVEHTTHIAPSASGKHRTIVVERE